MDEQGENRQYRAVPSDSRLPNHILPEAQFWGNVCQPLFDGCHCHSSRCRLDRRLPMRWSRIG